MDKPSRTAILYSEDFDAPEPTSSPPEVTQSPEAIVVEPTFSLADLQRAEERAKQEARAQEREDALSAAARRTTETVSHLVSLLQESQTEASRLVAAAASATAETLLAMVAAALPAFAATRGGAEAQALLRLLLPAMMHQPRLTIRAHPAVLDDLRGHSAAVLEGGHVVVEWLESGAMCPGDLSVRWEDGMMTRDTRLLCEAVLAIIMPEPASPSTSQEQR